MSKSPIHRKKDVTPWFVANFDSCSALAKSLGRFLHGKSFAGVGNVPESEALAWFINALPWGLEKSAYVKSSAHEAVDPEKLGQINAREFSEWATGLYPKKKYSSIHIGSSNGAGIHLAAAMGAPWLPQTFMIPVKNSKKLSVDEPISRMEEAVEIAKPLLSNNPDLQLHHMMDPSQDRPMLHALSYFRVKKLKLDEAYKKFILENLEPEGTIIIIECQKKWPVKQVDDRHYFQFGGLGGIKPEVYYNGSKEIKEFLAKNDSKFSTWNAPKPDSDQVESEWGFEPSLKEDIMSLARDNNFQVKCLKFKEPEDLSPFVADIHSWWYKCHNFVPDTLIVDMFFLLEPFRTLHSGSVPFWLAFNAKPSVSFIKEYLERNPYKNIFMMPFSNGVEGVDTATLDDFKSILAMAKSKGEFVGFDEDKYPFDFGIYSRYEKDLKKKINRSLVIKSSLTMAELATFSQQTSDKYKVELI